MSTSQLKTLSPAEKYDIFVGRYDYPTVNSEWRRTSPSDETWEGLCHGWAPASLYYKQPNPVTLRNPDGIAVPFGSSDIKALLTYFLAEYDQRTQRTYFVGERCKFNLQQLPGQANTSACADLNAGSYHVILANQIGLMNRGFLVDRDRGYMVWNQPVHQFQTSAHGTRPAGYGSSPSATEEMLMVTRMSYAKETMPAWEAHSSYVVTEEYRYWLELDSARNIVGGTFLSWDRPDFQWISEVGPFRGFFSALNTIYYSSIGVSPRVERSTDDTIPTSEKHQELTAKTAEFGTEGDETPNDFRQTWFINPQNASSITIHFQDFDTERHNDKLKIYEQHGEGALVAVLHGNELPKDIKLGCSCAFIVYTTDSSVKSHGFHATYTAE